MIDLKDIKNIYFLGIGGIGMSSLARYFAWKGAHVSGYDRTPTALTTQLIKEGMVIHFEDDPGQIPLHPDLVVYTPAIPHDLAELSFLKEKGFPLKKRAEVLGLISSSMKTIAVAGTHGKTTTSTLIAHLLSCCDIEHFAFLGGISRNYGTNFLFNASNHPTGNPYCVVEADEYDKSFLQLAPHIAIITSADADHLDIYGNEEELQKTFEEFTSRIQANGALILKQGTSITPIQKQNFKEYSYSLNGISDFKAKNIRIKEGIIHFDYVMPSGVLTDLILGIPGMFNLENAVAALAVGYLLGLDEKLLRTALQGFEGVQRRFEVHIRRPGLVYIDDYAHHPEELKACIRAVKEIYPTKKITGIFQPHLFSRTRDLANDFARSLEMFDELWLLDIYPARELPIKGVTSQMLLDLIRLKNKKLMTKTGVVDTLRSRKPEVLLTLGAGDIDQLVKPIMEALDAT
ncbi:MAG: UDP-N-acetylmuramate--L-alanine ligase [Bacteroidales bacterium]|nr:UDP-N-acetylmuramate--L-alanine ligase [Bacteroidales bacterium]